MTFSSIFTLAIFLIVTLNCYADQEIDLKFDTQCIDYRLVASYEDIVNLPKRPEVLLIDVRRPEEFEAAGSIPNSINMPFEAVKQDLQLEPEVFEDKYGRKKPSLDTPLIFLSRTGHLANEASHVAYREGFRNVRTYLGSWNEYAKIKGLKQQ